MEEELRPPEPEPGEPTPLWLKVAVGIAVALVLYIVGITTWVIFGNRSTARQLPTRTPLPTFTPYVEPQVVAPAAETSANNPTPTPRPKPTPTPPPKPNQTPTPKPGSGQKATQYTVQPGDTLSSISQKFGVPMEAIIAANGLKNPNAIYVGQVLTIPSQRAAKVHIVQPGETLLGIAAKYGVDYKELMKANGITDPNTIYAGQKLVIP